MEEAFRPNHLLDYELEYELKIRAVVTQRNVADKRKMLATLLAKERDSKKTQISELMIRELKFEDEQKDIDRSIKSISDIISDFEGNAQDSVVLRMKSRLAHVSNRIRRLSVGDDRDKTIYVQESLATCLTLEADLFDKVSNDSVEPSTSQTTSQPPIIHVAAPIVNCSGNIPAIGDWQVKFNGDGKNLYNFLERISELAQSRKVNVEDLFNSAAELFTGDAFIWYKSIKSSITDWQTLISRLKKDFLHSDIEDDLWDQIKGRKQKRSESVAVFIAHMQILFSRLSSPPAETTKIKHIRKNLLPEYITQLALSEVNHVDDLAKLCRKLEEASYIKNKNHSVHEIRVGEFSNVHHSRDSNNLSRPPNNNKNSKDNFNIPKHNFSKPKGNNSSNKPREFNSSGHPSKNDFKNHKQRNRNFNNSGSSSNDKSDHQNSEQSQNPIVCWNCGFPNHLYDNCMLKRKIFCFKCGRKDVKVNSCPNCLKN